MSEKYTILDIAKTAGVSRGTVSRVLNNHPSVSDSTRQKVLDVIKQLDYSPNFSARHMRTATSNMVGFATDEVITTPFAVDIIRGAQDALSQSGKVMIAIYTGYDRQTVQQSLEVLLERRVEGIVYAAMFHRQVDIPAQLAQRIPVVLANCFSRDRSLPSVVPDEVSGGYNATKALIDAGHLRIAFINLSRAWGEPIAPLPASDGRLEGYKKALAEANIPYDPNLLRYTDQRPTSSYELTLELMQIDNPPTAFFCGNDRTAMGCYNALMSLSLRIPDDVAVVGFDNQAMLCDALYPSLTTVQLPHYEMGQWAIGYLLNNPGPTDNPPQHMINCPLVPRQSI
ncbi:MAG: LacI family DNA-binding transcriptional regulator [Anaerolineae bacterium]|nr:LacI family DNA-binding transcriptional regulator [Anaerolineae bacterium]MCA9889245.1 LacI family DNA-binding transcriptional regulator [Anaerolineae bacterium]MCA9892518.1 LacI family DNA-binding transcriptional regulator [Anaerolineae bacterium]